MPPATTHRSAQPRWAAGRGAGIGLPTLAFGLFGAPIAWSLQLLVIYAVASSVCRPPGESEMAMPLGGASPALLGVSIATLAIAIGAGCAAVRGMRVARPATEEAQPDIEPGLGRDRFLTRAGILVSCLFILAILMNLATLFLVPWCNS